MVVDGNARASMLLFPLFVSSRERNFAVIRHVGRRHSTRPRGSSARGLCASPILGILENSRSSYITGPLASGCTRSNFFSVSIFSSTSSSTMFSAALRSSSRRTGSHAVRSSRKLLSILAEPLWHRTSPAPSSLAT